MKKIDGHFHLVRSLAGFNGKGAMNPLGNGQVVWDYDGSVIKLLPDGWGEDDFTIESALRVMDDHDVAKAVLLQGSLYGYQNYYAYQAVKAHPDRFIGAFSVDPFSEHYMKIVQRYVEDLGFRAMKFEVSQGGGMHGYHMTTPFRLDTDPRVGRIFHFVSDYPGFVITVDYGDASQYSYQPEAIANLAKMYPKLDFVVCHLSFPNADHLDRLQNALEQWQPYSNIYTDISAIQDIEGETNFPFPRCQKDIALAKEILGAKRIIWGTDSPWSATFNSYEELATWLEQTNIFTPTELVDVLYNNAEKVYFKDAAIAAVKNTNDSALKN
ncbi:amidohydrolase family protein [Lactobacillus sp. ESL0684]|uniref:amidohydrolase family protein n=1 Tax=Lactobacillus sp. ESL0684 TaxID=2983213 RepID=UPI0023F8F480|nr:amidohydrolase family protein [Lactobacillus sp. ESL0684]WEV43458.1 amidohydrolase family protein [Lactobacillus sp. ESL0684]